MYYYNFSFYFIFGRFANYFTVFHTYAVLYTDIRLNMLFRGKPQACTLVSKKMNEIKKNRLKKEKTKETKEKKNYLLKIQSFFVYSGQAINLLTNDMQNVNKLNKLRHTARWDVFLRWKKEKYSAMGERWCKSTTIERRKKCNTQIILLNFLYKLNAFLRQERGSIVRAGYNPYTRNAFHFLCLL